MKYFILKMLRSTSNNVIFLKKRRGREIQVQFSKLNLKALSPSKWHFSLSTPLLLSQLMVLPMQCLMGKSTGLELIIKLIIFRIWIFCFKLTINTVMLLIKRKLISRSNFSDMIKRHSGFYSGGLFKIVTYDPKKFTSYQFSLNL